MTPRLVFLRNNIFPLPAMSGLQGTRRRRFLGPTALNKRIAGRGRSSLISIKKHLKDSFGVFTATGSHAVRLKFDAFAGQLVRECVWHPSQKIHELADGGRELTLQLSSLLEIEPWVLSWGEHVRVVGPAELKKRVVGRLRAALG